MLENLQGKKKPFFEKRHFKYLFILSCSYFLGMRCLGIPNTAHFANVTQIEDAMALWEKLKNQKSEEAFKPEQEEEFEDSQGNVVNKKIYEDLKRQGLL